MSIKPPPPKRTVSHLGMNAVSLHPLTEEEAGTITLLLFPGELEGEVQVRVGENAIPIAVDADSTAWRAEPDAIWFFDSKVRSPIECALLQADPFQSEACKPTTLVREDPDNSLDLAFAEHFDIEGM